MISTQAVKRCYFILHYPQKVMDLLQTVVLALNPNNTNQH